MMTGRPPPTDPHPTADGFGLLWRDELAAGILSSSEEIDTIELLADAHYCNSPQHLRALRELGRECRLLVHSTGLGLASTETVERGRLDRLARFMNAVGSYEWSEHIAFVRGGGIEIGHLAPPVRTEDVLEGLLNNVRAAARVIGSKPGLENIAFMGDLPGCEMSGVEWIRACIQRTDCDLLLDLHNLYANAMNYGYDACGMMLELPLDRVCEVHIAGGRMIGPAGDRRLLDDHLHSVPDAVFELLEVLAAACPQPLSIILERDGRFPAVEVLLMELRRAREAVAAGRAAGGLMARVGTSWSMPRQAHSTTGRDTEAVLARVLTESAFRAGWSLGRTDVDQVGIH